MDKEFEIEHGCFQPIRFISSDSLAPEPFVFFRHTSHSEMFKSKAAYERARRESEKELRDEVYAKGREFWARK